MHTTICGAKTRSGGRCKNAPVAAGRCRMHGGASLRGVASPTFKHGRFSKYLPVRLATRYREALADPELLKLNHEIALVDARLQDVLTRIDSGECGTAWDRALKAFESFQRQMEGRDLPGVQACLTELGQILRRGHADVEAWNEVVDVIEHRRRLVDSVMRHQVQAQQVLALDQAMLLISALAHSVREHVQDRDTLAKIQAEFVKLTETTGVQAVPAAGPLRTPRVN
jgi:hypothetical protein